MSGAYIMFLLNSSSVENNEMCSGHWGSNDKTHKFTSVMQGTSTALVRWMEGKRSTDRKRSLVSDYWSCLSFLHDSYVHPISLICCLIIGLWRLLGGGVMESLSSSGLLLVMTRWLSDHCWLTFVTLGSMVAGKEYRRLALNMAKSNIKYASIHSAIYIWFVNLFCRVGRYLWVWIIRMKQ